MRKLRCLISWALAASFCILFVSHAMGQDYRARVEGLVTDPSKAVIAAAKVTLLNVNTGVRTVRDTSPTGLYVFDLVEPGTYTISVEVAGFGKFLQENFPV